LRQTSARASHRAREVPERHETKEARECGEGDDETGRRPAVQESVVVTDERESVMVMPRPRESVLQEISAQVCRRRRSQMSSCNDPVNVVGERRGEPWRRKRILQRKRG
jgi:hypothetical protein